MSSAPRPPITAEVVRIRPADGSDTRGASERAVDDFAQQGHRIARKGARAFDALRSLWDAVLDLPTDSRGEPLDR